MESSELESELLKKWIQFDSIELELNSVSIF